MMMMLTCDKSQCKGNLRTVGLAANGHAIGGPPPWHAGCAALSGRTCASYQTQSGSFQAIADKARRSHSHWSYRARRPRRLHPPQGNMGRAKPDDRRRELRAHVSPTDTTVAVTASPICPAARRTDVRKDLECTDARPPGRSRQWLRLGALPAQVCLPLTEALTGPAAPEPPESLPLPVGATQLESHLVDVHTATARAMRVAVSPSWLHRKHRAVKRTGLKGLSSELRTSASADAPRPPPPPGLNLRERWQVQLLRRAWPSFALRYKQEMWAQESLRLEPEPDGVETWLREVRSHFGYQLHPSKAEAPRVLLFNRSETTPFHVST